MTETKTQTIEASTPPGVSGHSAQIAGYSVSLSNVRGKVHASYSNANPFKLDSEAVWLYKEAPPAKPNEGSVWGVWVNGSAYTYDTGQLWGPGWSAGLAAKTYPNSAFEYLATTPVTGS